MNGSVGRTGLDLNPEMQWLLGAAAAAHGCRTENLTPHSEPDWTRLHSLALMHEVAPLSYVGSKSSAHCHQMPETLESRLRADYLFHFASNGRLLTEVAEIHRQLTAADIPAVFHSDLWLTFCAYPDAASRPARAIGLSLEARQYAAALKSLRRGGYRLEAGLPAEGEAAAAVAAGSLRLHAKTLRPLCIHLIGTHWRQVWNKSRPYSAIHPEARVAGLQTGLVAGLSALNGEHVKLRDLHDLRYLIEAGGEDTDWEELSQIQSPPFDKRLVAEALSFLRYFLGVKLPRSIRLKAFDPNLPRAAKSCRILGADSLSLPAAAHSSNPSLHILAVHYGSDKGRLGYTAHYERLFAPLRQRKLNLLEIGIGGHADPKAGGASLRMWKRFFPNANISGIDKYAKAIREARIRCFQGSQQDLRFLDEVALQIGPIDIVIDDGSHISSDVITAFTALFPYVTGGGIYVIEDIEMSYKEPRGRRSITYFKDLIDAANSELLPGRPPVYLDSTVAGVEFYRNLVIVHKRSRPS